MILAFILYAIGAFLVFQILREDAWKEPLGIDLAIAAMWPIVIPMMQLWTFLERKS